MEINVGEISDDLGYLLLMLKSSYGKLTHLYDSQIFE